MNLLQQKNIRKNVRNLLFILFSLTTVNAFAFDYNQKQQFFAFGISFGGEELARTSNETLEAGGGLSMLYGFNIIGRGNFHYQVSIGFERDTISASNGNGSFEKITSDFIILKKYGKTRFGAGLSFHFNPTFESNSQGSDISNEMPDTIGVITQFDIITKKNFTFGLQYEFIEYKPEGLINTNTGNKVDSFDGNNMNLLFKYHFN